ncbi:hypothetical protein [Limosilactobacillus difficilis]|uniref:hypothetical protein n=1 Tax=Limosilactobacillus difficilis TaxID=2991838 RepID=UPI0024BA48F8|nr:hypothetical protein [Limosilactobacillus difficilis]
MAKISEARRKANKKWNDNNKDKQRLYQYRSNAKHFILEMASEKDLDNFANYIDQRRTELSKH